MGLGHSDGKAWSELPWTEVEAWQADLPHHAPGSRESLLRVDAQARAVEAGAAADERLLVSHGGWTNALLPARKRLIAPQRASAWHCRRPSQGPRAAAVRGR